MKKRLVVLAGVLCMGCLLFGCGKEKAEEKEVEKEEPEITYQVIGRESEDAYKVLLTNNTENIITGMQVKDSGQTEYPANMMAADQKIEKDETVEFYYTPETAAEDNVNAEENAENVPDENSAGDTPEIADAVVNIVYSLQITFEDGSVHELSSFAVDDIEEAVVNYEEEVAFLAYKSKSEDIEINTKEAELAVKADKAAAQAVSDQIQSVGEVTLESGAAIQAARAAYDALTDIQKQWVANGQLLVEQESVLAALQQQAAEQAAAAQAAAEQAAAQQAAERAARQNNSRNNSSSGGSSSSGNSGGASQGTDSCLGDVVLN